MRCKEISCTYAKFHNNWPLALDVPNAKMLPFGSPNNKNHISWYVQNVQIKKNGTCFNDILLLKGQY